MEDEDEYCPPSETIKENYDYEYIVYSEDDDMPYKYRHIRKYGQRSVKNEYYVLMHKLKSELHMSENQAQGAICAVANILFV